MDATRSIAAGEWVLTPLARNWAAIWPVGLDGFEGWAGAVLPDFLRERLLLPVLGFPGWAVLGAIAVLLGMASSGAGREEIRGAQGRAG